MIGTDVQKAKEWLDAGDVVGIPTETVYGLAGNALNLEAVIKIFKVKNRPSFDPLIMHIAHSEQLSKYVKNIPQVILDIAHEFTPGPITFLLAKLDFVPDLLTSGSPMVAIRIPNHPATLELLSCLDYPLAAPSANPFGYISPTLASHVEKQLGDKVPYILDGGPCKIGLESTIIATTEDDQIRVLRKGGLSLDKLQKFCKRPLIIDESSSSRPDAPGMLSSHYAPSKPIYRGEIEELFSEFSNTKIGVLGFQMDFQAWRERNTIALDLSPSGDLEEAASHLFSYLRLLDESEAVVIICPIVPEVGLGLAINDRLKRAAFKTINT